MVYEQPLNEQLRLCLRLEYLFAQVDHYSLKESSWDIHQTLKLILEILQVTDRTDLKNKFFQTLNQYINSLSQLKRLDNIDNQKLNVTLKQLEYLIDELHGNQKKIGQKLRENEFLNTIQQRLYTPAGTCGFSLPAYHLWIQQEVSFCQQQLHAWLDQFRLLREIVELIMKLTRESTMFKTIIAKGGFYQSHLDSNLSYQLIRIKLLTSNNTYPEISVGRWRLAIHFFTLDSSCQAAQSANDIKFELACCRM